MKHASAHSILPEYVPRSTSFDGRFGRIFGKLPPWVPPGVDDTDREQRIRDFAEDEMFHPKGNEPIPENENLPVGYTYLGQFIDHDITFDTSSSLQRQNDPDGLRNFRSPRLDLDSLYGRGFVDQPYLYEHDARGQATGFLRVGTGKDQREPDLLRNDKGVALIGDPRNDENVIVSQLHLTFVKLHNVILRKLVDGDAAKVKDSKLPATPHEELFQEAQRLVRWTYQYMVWNDFVKRIVPDTIWAKALKKSESSNAYELGLDHIYDWQVAPYIPVEFSVAAYRFGHSLIRSGYQISIPRQKSLVPEGQNFIGEQFELPIFDPEGKGNPDLRGGRPLPALFTLQWDWYFDIGSFRLNSTTPPFPQLSHMIDTKLSRGVFEIPGPNGTNPLAALNILRGWRFNLPSGPNVARAMGFEPLSDLAEMEHSLWVYILKEAQVQQGGRRLGDVGGTIVAAVFAGLLKGDPLSFVEQFPGWTPSAEPILASLPRHGVTGDAWKMADIIRMAGMPVSGGDIDDLLKAAAPVA